MRSHCHLAWIALTTLHVPAVASDPPSVHIADLSPITIDAWFSPPDYAGCGESWFEDNMLFCDQIVSSGFDFGAFTPYWLWVIVAGVPPVEWDPGEPSTGGIGAIQFGIDYDPTAGVSSWILCTGGSEIPQDDAGGRWPASGTGNAVTWPGGCYDVTENPDGATKVGIFYIDPGSTGQFRFARDPRVDMALSADCATEIQVICDEQLGIGDCAPDGTDFVVACGTRCDAVPVREASWSVIKSLYR